MACSYAASEPQTPIRLRVSQNPTDRHRPSCPWQLGGSNFVLWGGRDGYQSLLNTDYAQELNNYASFLKATAAYAKEIGFKGQLLLEPKPREPMAHQCAAASSPSRTAAVAAARHSCGTSVPYLPIRTLMMAAGTTSTLRPRWASSTTMA